ncbi:hypothetical protein QTH89_14600 [Variovorax sp. J22G21]|uniref:hypothetical protein n=1 Tax=Variovorax fucosicus TaxID=3053517 RepID=UPI0025771D0D|nr:MULTISPECIES: hypothetical protein [unclassified Variovorax]MDM0037652.1 hypothetical protein [Variovorax sp. J22R193]MDM0062428.1 hypothetical protein [Variovorax sp. J22G21]
MKTQSSEQRTQRIRYRGVSIDLRVEEVGGRIFAHADLFAKKEFRGRLSIGRRRGAAGEALRTLEGLAKARVDLWAIEASARAAGARRLQADMATKPK